MSVPINLTWLISVRKSLCSVEWMSLSKWLGTTLWQSPYGQKRVNPMRVTWMISMRKSLSKWSESMRNEWIEVNWVNRGEMSEWMEMTWNNPMRKSLWSVESVPIKVTWDEWFDQTLSKWSESMRNEWNEVNRVNRGEMSDLMDLTLWTLWESPYESVEGVPIKVTWLNPMRMSLSKWMELMRFEWIEVNRTIRGEMSDLKDLMRSTLWESPYGR